jgi:hypothetical protein
VPFREWARYRFPAVEAGRFRIEYLRRRIPDGFAQTFAVWALFPSRTITNSSSFCACARLFAGGHAALLRPAGNEM